MRGLEYFLQTFKEANLLLDLYPADAAYSLRKLRSDYSGSAIRVRRSSDNAEQDIGFVNSELDTASLLSFVGVSNGNIQRIYDQSGNGIDVIENQINKNQWCLIVNAGSLVTNNGKVGFEVLNGSNLRSAINYSNSILSMITVANNTSTDPINRLFGIEATSSGTAKETFAQDSDNSLRFDGAAQLGTITAVVGNKIRYSQRNGNALLDFINNAQNINASVTLPASVGRINLGNTRFNDTASFEGFIHEAIMWFDDQSANRVAIQDNINAYYNIY